MRKLVLAVVLAVAALAVADLALEAYVEHRASQQVSESLGAPAAVTLSGWPVALRMVGGHLPRADVEAGAGDLPGAPARLASLQATLRDIDVDRRGLFDAERPLLVRARGGTADTRRRPGDQDHPALQVPAYIIRS
jgi:hypothetical protein